jgi:hypothetical protein
VYGFAKRGVLADVALTANLASDELSFGRIRRSWDNRRRFSRGRLSLSRKGDAKDEQWEKKKEEFENFLCGKKLHGSLPLQSTVQASTCFLQKPFC